MVDKVSKKEDKDLFEEAVGSYLAGYNRASYIMTWVTIVESLKNRIHEYANLENKVAIGALSNIESAEKAKRSVDLKIIEEAKNCNLLDENEYQTIEFLWKQRCIFAHPYQKSPSEEEIKLALYKAVEIVLSKDLMYGKFQIEELIENVISKPYFLPNDLLLVESIAIDQIKLIPEKLYPFFFKTLLAKVGIYENDQNKILLVNKIRVCLVCLFDTLDSSFAYEKLGLEHRATEFPYTSFVGYVHNKTWSKLEERTKDILFNYVVTIDDIYKKNIVRTIVKRLISENILEESYIYLYKEILDRDSFLTSINFYGSADRAYDRIKKELLTGNFKQQNVVLDFLRSQNGVDVILKLSNFNQLDLGRLVYYCAEEGNWKSQLFVEEILNNISQHPVSLKEGLFIGVFIDKNDRLSINYAQLSKVAKVVDSLGESTTDKLFKIVFNAINIEAREGRQIYIPIDNLNMLKEEVIETKLLTNEGVREHFRQLFTKIEALIGDEADLPF